MAKLRDKGRLNNLANEIWKSAERLRGKFKAYEYQNVILPIIVLRRIECVLIEWREKQAEAIRKRQPDITDKELERRVKALEKNPRQMGFWNKTSWTLKKVVKEDPTLTAENFREYINGFSLNVQEIIDYFDYRATIGRMVKNSRLGPILNQYSTLTLGPKDLANLEMGYIYEEILRRFSEQSGEEAGEHFTPREVIRLMVELLGIPIPEKHISIYDPACGTGGMLSVAKEHLLERTDNGKDRAAVERYVTVHGHELQPANYAICLADMLLKADKNAEVKFGNSLIPHSQHSREPGDQLPEPKHSFDFMLSNPPFGVTWGGKDGYETEARKLEKTRYRAGMPRTNDGALLFLQTMLAKMKPADQGGSRIAIIFNGSPLSNGDCGQGESEIRRWILENDWLDTIVMLPDQLFYNTGIFTYVWLLTNKKPKSHKQRIMIIDARKQFDKEPKSFGNKRNRILDEHRTWIEDRYRDGWADGYEDDCVQLFTKESFAYHKVSVVFWQTDENDKPAYVTEPYQKTFSPANVKKDQDFYASDLEFSIAATHEGVTRELAFTLKPEDSYVKVFEKRVRAAFANELAALTKGIGKATDRNKIINRFSKELDLTATYTHRHYVADSEYIPFGEDIEAFLEREIAKQIIRWEDAPQLGYEILPNKYFYRYEPPKAADAVLEDFWNLERAAEDLLKGLAAGKRAR